jgi:hypothetical protein
MMKFRNWVQEMYFENQDELLGWSDMRPSNNTLSAYFNRYKWWLRREYRYYQSRNLKGIKS